MDAEIVAPRPGRINWGRGLWWTLIVLAAVYWLAAVVTTVTAYQTARTAQANAQGDWFNHLLDQNLPEAQMKATPPPPDLQRSPRSLGWKAAAGNFARWAIGFVLLSGGGAASQWAWLGFRERAADNPADPS